MNASNYEDTGDETMPVTDSCPSGDGSIGAWSKDEHPKGGIAGDMRMDRRSFAAWLLTAPFALKASLAAALDSPTAPIVPAESADPLCYASVDELKAMFQAGKASPVDLLKAQIKRIEALNPKVNCITYTHFDQALEEAKQSEERYRRGDARPLEGITVSLKDEVGFFRPGWRTTQGSLLFKDAQPVTESGAVVDMLEAAGAIMPFQTTVPEFYLFLGASTRAWGTTRNPWNLEWTPGGSSAGSGVALAAGFSTLAMGSDMGGSIRIPSSQCGLYGFRPPFGRVASAEIPFSTSGPMARRFDDLVHLQNAIVGPSEKVMAAIRPRLDYPSQYPDLSGWRIAVDWGAGIADVIPSVRNAMLQGIETLRAAGCVVDEVDCGFSKKDKRIFLHGLMSSAMGTLIEIANSRRDLLSPYMEELLDQVGTLGPRQAEEADELLELYHRQVQQRVFGKGYRILLMPTMATPLVGADMFKSKETITDPWVGTGLGFALTWHWNLLNRYPILDVPLGVVEDRMPTGMQVIGQTFSDLDTFQFAANWSRLQPPLFAEGRFPTFA
jgi:amidase